ncbi:MAG: phage major capsid protein [Actinobacteria bacterium]|nr:phage major capsid protein [Actinomycetota bacterium]
MLRSGISPAFLPDQISELVVIPVQRESVAMRVATVHNTDRHEFVYPLAIADPAAAWTAEGADITAAEISTGEGKCNPFKIAGLSVISNELAADSSPEAATMIGQGLARDIAAKVDAAFFGNTTSNGPAGLGSLASVSTTRANSTAYAVGDRVIGAGKLFECTVAGTSHTSAPSWPASGTVTDGTVTWKFLMWMQANGITPGASWANLDPFLEAIYASEGMGADVTAFCANPADALTLAQLKEATGSNKALLQPDPTQPTRRTIAGVPLYVSPSVAVGTVWGVPKAAVYMVVRNDTTLEVDKSRYFESDSTAIRAIMRVGIAFPMPGAVQRVYIA